MLEGTDGWCGQALMGTQDVHWLKKKKKYLLSTTKQEGKYNTTPPCEVSICIQFVFASSTHLLVPQLATISANMTVASPGSSIFLYMYGNASEIKTG